MILLNNWKALNSTRTLLISRLCQPEVFPDSDSEPAEIACIYCAFLAPTQPEVQRHMTLVDETCNVEVTWNMSFWWVGRVLILGMSPYEW